jgi:putative flavoprotein involved in K+ transport
LRAAGWSSQFFLRGQLGKAVGFRKKPQKCGLNCERGSRSREGAPMIRMMELLVIGAGPAGLAAAGAAREKGTSVQVLEAATSVGTSWRGHYDRLHLHTTRRLSALPGQEIPRRAGTWVARDDYIAYLEDYARRQDIPIRFQTRVERIDRGDSGWRLQTSAGELQAPALVVATGYNHSPLVPDWPGRDSFAGELIHSSAYRNPGRYRGKDVLVVGSGNSGAEIAADLVEGGAGYVWNSIRTSPNIVRRNVGPLANQHLGILASKLPPRFVDWLSLAVQRAAIGDLSPYGLETPTQGAYTRVMADEQIPLIDVGFLRELKAGRIRVVPGVERFAGAWVICGHHRVKPDVVIAATGYRRALDSLVGHLGVLAASGRPSVHAPKSHPKAPGLYFIGYTNPLVGNLYEVTQVAQRLAASTAATS